MLERLHGSNEASRLGTGCFQIEYARTQELILRHLPPAPATIVDAEAVPALMPAGSRRVVIECTLWIP